jgi:uncharacterized protein YqjF (DUF2071 family)
MLPYYRATMDFMVNGNEFRFESQRTIGPSAGFSARWQAGVRLRDPDADSLAFFLVERYALFAGTSENLAMTRIYHHPWILEEAIVQEYRSTMLSALNLPEPSSAPLAHFSRVLNVEVWEPIAV